MKKRIFFTPANPNTVKANIVVEGFFKCCNCRALFDEPILDVEGGNYDVQCAPVEVCPACYSTDFYLVQ